MDESSVFDALTESQEETRRLKADLAKYKQWVADLHSGMYINCVYCGHRYGPQDEVPTTMADVLKEHIEQCPEHPMSVMKKELTALKEVVRGAVEKWRKKADTEQSYLDRCEHDDIKADAYRECANSLEDAISTDAENA